MTEKIMAYQKCFIGPLVWKSLTNDFELLLSEKLKFEHFCPGSECAKMTEKMMAYQKMFIGPLV